MTFLFCENTPQLSYFAACNTQQLDNLQLYKLYTSYELGIVECKFLELSMIDLRVYIRVQEETSSDVLSVGTPTTK